MLSVVITTWNEEKTLPRAVNSVKKIADEIVVVDTESSDKTVEVAKRLGCKVFTHKNTGIVEPIRNFSISKAKGDWILLMDADEELPASLAQKIKGLVTEKNVIDFYRIPRKNIIFGKWIKSEHWWPDYVYRLFRKDHITWEDTIHSIPFTRGQGGELPAHEDLSIVHHHYSSISQYVDRLNRYTDYQVKKLLEEGYSFSWKDLIIKPIDEFITQYFARKGYKEQVHGLALSGLQGFSELVLYLKMWQHDGFVESQIKSNELKEIIDTKGQEFNWWRNESQIQSAPLLLKPFLKLKRKLGL